MGIFQTKKYQIIKCLLILLLLAIFGRFSAASKPTIVAKLGAMFSSENLTVPLQDRLGVINDDLTSSNVSLQFKVVAFSMNSNPIRAALDVCENILNQNVYTVFVNQDNMTNDAVLGISYTSGFFEVPIVGIGVRDAIFSDRNIHPTFLRTVSPLYNQAKVWLEILKHYKWNKVLTVTTNEYESKTLLAKFLALISDGDIKVEKSVHLLPGELNVTTELSKFSKTISRVILFFVNAHDAEIIYRDASNLSLNEKGYVWFVPEQTFTREDKTLIALTGKKRFSPNF